MKVLTLPADDGTWSAAMVVSSRDRALRELRDPARWDAALALYPLAAHWRDGEFISGVEIIAGIEDRVRNFVVAGDPVATGVVAVGDSWACTDLSLGRGATIAMLHAVGLRDLLRDTDPGEHDKLARRFHDWTAAAVEPLHRDIMAYDRHRLAEFDADLAGVSYRTDDRAWAAQKATYAASLIDSDVTRAHLTLGSMLGTADEVFAEPGLAEKIGKLGGHALDHPLAGPERRELLAALRAGGYRVIGGAALWPQLAAPEKVNALLPDFLG
jgi:hypothetical protein